MARSDEGTKAAKRSRATTAEPGSEAERPARAPARPPKPADERPEPRAARPRERAAKAAPARLLNPQVVQVALLCMMLASVYATVTLASYDQNDPSFNQATMRPVQNVGGRAGAYLADLLLQAFGVAAWGVVPLTGLLAWLLAGRPLGGWARLIGSGLLSWALMLALGLIFGPDASRGYILGGYLGVTSAELLLGPLGPVGAWLTLAATLVLSLSLLTRIDWGQLAGKAVDGVEAGVPLVRGAGLRIGRSAVQGVRSAGGALVGAAQRRTGPEITVSGDEDDDDVDDLDELSDEEPRSEALRPPSPAPRSPQPRPPVAEPPAAEAPRGPVRIRAHEGAALPGRRVDARHEALPPGLALQRHEASGLRPVRIGIAESAQRASGLPVTTYEEPSLGLLSPPTARPPELGEPVSDRTQFARRSLAEVEWEPTGLERPDRTVAEPPWPVRVAPPVDDAPSRMDGFDRPRQVVRPPQRAVVAAPPDEDALDDEGEVWAEALSRKPVVAPVVPAPPVAAAVPTPPVAPRPAPAHEADPETPLPVLLRPRAPPAPRRPAPRPRAQRRRLRAGATWTTTPRWTTTSTTTSTMISMTTCPRPTTRPPTPLPTTRRTTRSPRRPRPSSPRS